MQTLGPTSGLLNKSLHFNNIPGDSHTHKISKAADPNYTKIEKVGVTSIHTNKETRLREVRYLTTFTLSWDSNAGLIPKASQFPLDHFLRRGTWKGFIWVGWRSR